MEKRKRGRPKTNFREAVNKSQSGLPEGYTRATIITHEATLSKIKAIAYWERLLIKEVIDEALESYVKAYEKKRGEVKNIPKKNHRNSLV